MHVYERRRLAVVAVLTLIAVPAVFALDRSGGSSAEDVPGAVIPATAEQALDDLAVDVVVDTIAPEIPVFLDNEVVVPAPAVIDIARPAGPSSTEATASASYKRYVDAPVPRPCTTRLAPSGATITVTNLNNGMSTTCTNTLGVSVPAGADMTLDTSLFIGIAELVDAPVPVRLSW
jgi:hypothetical protein